MRGEFLGVWRETYGEIWIPVEQAAEQHKDLYCELYRYLFAALSPNPDIEKQEETRKAFEIAINNPELAQPAFEKVTEHDLIGEKAIVTFFESIHAALENLGGDTLSNRYFNLLSGFIEKFNLRYDLRRPCTLCPTLPGVFASLVRDLRTLTSRDPHLDSLMKAFENSIRDLRTDCSDDRIKTCISKQVNLLEAVGRTLPGVTGNTLGAICTQAATWPHKDVRDAIKALYGFASDYPGIRHGGTPANAIRNIEMRDMIAMTILLVGFTPYLTEQLNADMVYRGS